MRLRSTQFVFLMLLLCSVQMRQDCALHLMASVTDSGTRTEERVTAPANAGTAARYPAPQPVRLATFPLTTSVTAPQRHAMSVNSFTGLRRA